MAEPPEREEPHEDLARALAVLASPTRLDLLALLRSPRSVREIEVAPRRSTPDADPNRFVGERVIRKHLDLLSSVGLIREHASATPASAGARYVVDWPRFYALAEAFRSFANLPAAAPPGEEATLPADVKGAHDAVVAGPRVAVVHGAYEGRTVALAPDRLQGGRWVIGRHPGCAVALEYDPYVSREHAGIVPVATGFALVDLARSHNGTWVNWRRLPAAARHPLRPGDVIGVGLSLLVFAT